MRTITAEEFEKATGHPPVQDDLERCNCDKAGQMGHWQCGWDEERNLPVFVTGYKDFIQHANDIED